jgi:hypothetical protein
MNDQHRNRYWRDLRFAAYQPIPEPELRFNARRPSDRSSHPLRGLLDFGPFSSSIVPTVSNPIRVASINPRGETKAVPNLLRELEGPLQARERQAYLPRFEGMQRTFGVRALPAASETHIELPELLESEIANGDRPQRSLADSLTGAIRTLANLRSEFDVVCIYLPNRWRHAFVGAPNEDFDLHDYVKAVAAQLGITTQILLEDGVFEYFCRASVGWHVGIGLYVKAGGTPWVLSGIDSNTAFVGISYAVRAKVHDQPHFVTCCSQIFDDDGSGLEFIAYETSPDADHFDGNNPFLTRDQMRGVMARTLDLYSRRRGGAAPTKLVVHKSTAFTDDEVNGCMDALSAIPDVILLQIQNDSPWLGVKLERQSDGARPGPTPFPVNRGTLVPLGGKDALLWTSGNVRQADGRNYYKEGTSVPSPIMLRCFAGSASWFELGQQVLALTKMNWNNDALYDRLPTTMGYAQILARVLKRVDNLSSRSYPFRLFM